VQTRGGARVYPNFPHPHIFFPFPTKTSRPRALPAKAPEHAGAAGAMLRPVAGWRAGEHASLKAPGGSGCVQHEAQVLADLRLLAKATAIAGAQPARGRLPSPAGTGASTGSRLPFALRAPGPWPCGPGPGLMRTGVTLDLREPSRHSHSRQWPVVAANGPWSGLVLHSDVPMSATCTIILISKCCQQGAPMCGISSIACLCLCGCSAGCWKRHHMPFRMQADAAVRRSLHLQGHHWPVESHVAQQPIAHAVE
jgi:hypothetical protein